jgi:hypothetical protein
MLGIGKAIRSLSAAMVPIRKAEFPNIGKAIKHPVQTVNDALSNREVMIYLMRGINIESIPAIRFANVVFNHEVGMGWFIMPGSAKQSYGETCYFCHEDIPYTLDIHKAAASVDLNEQMQELLKDDKGELKGLGLPDKLLKLNTQSIDQFALAKWHAGFDEIGGNGMVFLFGVFGGIVVGLVLTLLLLSLLAAVG